MADTTYPIGMYKDHGPEVEPEVRYAHTRKEEEALAEAGFTNDRRNLPPNDYPRILCNLNGDQIRVVGKVEETAAIELGYGRKFVLKAESKKNGAITPETATASNGRLDTLEDEMSSLKATMAEILAAVSQKKK